MFKNYLRIAFRNLWRSNSFSLLNIIGLAVGMASATLILLWIHNESTYDAFHPNKDRLYLAYNRGIISNKLVCWPNTPQPLGPALLKDYPAVKKTSRIHDRWFVTVAGERKMSTHANVVDPAFLTMLDFPLLKGDPNTALNNSSSMVVTEEMAKKMFGNDDPMNKVVRIDKNSFTVTGVMKDLPTNTNFDFEFLIPFSFAKAGGFDYPQWDDNNVQTLVELQPTAKPDVVNQQIRDITVRNSKGEETNQVFLHPLTKVHLYGEFENGKN